MKKILCLLVIVLILGACSSLSSNNNQQWFWKNGGLETAGIPKNTIAYLNSPNSLPPGQELSLFGKINWFNYLLSYLNLHENLSYSGKLELFDALFAYIPAVPVKGIFRVIGIGEYFSNNMPLVFYLSYVAPPDNSPPGTMGILAIIGNFAAFRSPQTGQNNFLYLKRESFSIINWVSSGAVFPDNLLVRRSEFYSAERIERYLEEYGDYPYLFNVNIADSYIDDQITENDQSAFELLTEAYENSIDPTIRMTAQLNLFKYYLYMGSSEEAETALSLAAEILEETENPDPAFGQVIYTEAETMLRIYKDRES